jgi:hypothetical protein
MSHFFLLLDLGREYMEYHKGEEAALLEKPLKFKQMDKVCSDKWDAAFIDRIASPRKNLYTILKASNYLDIKGLMNLAAAKVASLIKGEPVDKLKTILHPDTTDAEKKDEKKDDAKKQDNGKEEANKRPKVGDK